MKAVAWMLNDVGVGDPEDFPVFSADKEAVELTRGALLCGHDWPPEAITITELCAVNPELVDKLLELFDAAWVCNTPSMAAATKLKNIACAHNACKKLVTAHRDATTEKA